MHACLHVLAECGAVLLLIWRAGTRSGASSAGPADFFAFTVEARKLEHHYPRALKVKYRESQQETSKVNVPTF